MNHLKISEVQVVPIIPKDGHLGFASFVYDDCLYVSSIGIYSRLNGGYRLTFPTRGNGAKQNICYPIRKDLSDELERIIGKKYEEIMGIQ